MILRVTKFFFIFSTIGILIIGNSALGQTEDKYKNYGLDITAGEVDQIPKVGEGSGNEILNEYETPIGVTEGATKPSIPKVLGRLIGVAISMLSVFFLVIMIYGGFTWMIARGNEADIESAKKMIVSAFWGLLAILMGYAMIYFRVSEEYMRGIFF